MTRPQICGGAPSSSLHNQPCICAKPHWRILTPGAAPADIGFGASALLSRPQRSCHLPVCVVGQAGTEIRQSLCPALASYHLRACSSTVAVFIHARLATPQSAQSCNPISWQLGAALIHLSRDQHRQAQLQPKHDTPTIYALHCFFLDALASQVPAQS